MAAELHSLQTIIASERPERDRDVGLGLGEGDVARGAHRAEREELRIVGEPQCMLAASEQRADDLRRSLRTFDAGRGGGRFGAVLQQFEQLSKQLVLLQERSIDTNAQALLERHFVVPSAVSGFEAGTNTTVVPHLLSTMLDKEQEEQAPHQPILATAHGSDELGPTPATIAAHNQIIDAAYLNLSRLASHANLPGSGSIFADNLAPGKRFASRPPAAAGEDKRQRTSAP